MSPRRMGLIGLAALALGGCERERTFHVRAELIEDEAQLPAPSFRLVSDVDRGRCAHVVQVDVVDADTDAGLLETMWSIYYDVDDYDDPIPCLESFTYGVVPEQYKRYDRVYPEPEGWQEPGVLRRGRRYAVRVTFRWDKVDAYWTDGGEPEGSAQSDTAFAVDFEGRLRPVDPPEGGEGS